MFFTSVLIFDPVYVALIYNVFIFRRVTLLLWQVKGLKLFTKTHMLFVIWGFVCGILCFFLLRSVSDSNINWQKVPRKDSCFVSPSLLFMHVGQKPCQRCNRQEKRLLTTMISVTWLRVKQITITKGAVSDQLHASLTRSFRRDMLSAHTGVHFIHPLSLETQQICSCCV